MAVPKYNKIDSHSKRGTTRCQYGRGFHFHILNILLILEKFVLMKLGKQKNKANILRCSSYGRALRQYALARSQSERKNNFRQCGEDTVAFEKHNFTALTI